MHMVDPLDSPGILVPPPVIFAAGFLTGLLLDRVLDLPHFAPPPLIGAFLLSVAVGLVVWALATMIGHHTSFGPRRGATRLVTTGPYRFSRNPMYMALTAAYVGLALEQGRLGPLALLLPTLWALFHLVIVREERHLAARFAADYQRYRTRVRRWL